jgi:hypothetical protein
VAFAGFNGAVSPHAETEKSQSDKDDEDSVRLHLLFCGCVRYEFDFLPKEG